jgi:hypothetical protein
MSFAAMATWQAWALIVGAGLGAWWIFRLKVRPPRRTVPSLIVWRRVVDSPSDRPWWERVRRAVSLVVTVVVALALALAVGRPGPRAPTGSVGRLLIVLDSSWSMRGETRAGGTRWEHAVAFARALAQSTAGEVALATTADGLVEGPTSDSALIATALDRLEPAGGEGLAWPRVENVGATHFFTDGAVLRPIEPDTIVHSVFSPAGNVAITAFGARPATSSSTSAAAYLEVANYAEAGQRAHVTVTRGTAVIADRWLVLGPAEVSRQVIPLDQPGGSVLRAHVSASDNALDVDDEAVAWLAAGDQIDVAIVSQATSALADLLRHEPGVRASVVRPSDYQRVKADVVIFDRWAPPAPPGRPALYLAPPLAPWLGRPARDELSPQWTVRRSHPVLDGVDPLTLDITRARPYDAPAWQPVAVSARGTPLVSVLDSPEARGVLLGFSTAESNLASAPAFPVLIGNILDWLARPVAAEVRAPGPIALPASTTAITGPDGASVPVVRAGDRVLARLRQPGLYRVDAGGSRSVVGVNVGSPAVANLTRTNLTASDATMASGLAGRPWWIYAVGLAFVLLVVEWFTWQRRITV